MSNTVGLFVYQISQQNVATGNNLLNGTARSNNRAGTVKSLGSNQTLADNSNLGSPKKPRHVGYRLSQKGSNDLDTDRGPRYPRGGQVMRSIPEMSGQPTDTRPTQNDDVVWIINEGDELAAIRTNNPQADLSLYWEGNLHGHYARGVIKGLGRNSYTKLKGADTPAGGIPNHPLGFNNVPFGHNTAQQSIRKIESPISMKYFGTYGTGFNFITGSSPYYNLHMRYWKKDSRTTANNINTDLTNTHQNQQITNSTTTNYGADQQFISRSTPGEITFRNGAKKPINSDYSSKNT